MKDIKQYLVESIDSDYGKLMGIARDIVMGHLKEDKSWSKDLWSETKDELDEQDDDIAGNDCSSVWQLFSEIANKAKMDVDDVWDIIGGSYDMFHLIENVEKELHIV